MCLSGFSPSDNTCRVNPKDQQARIFVVPAGAPPTQRNSAPLKLSNAGRCSLVLYSPATLLSTVGFEGNTLQGAVKAGGEADVDWDTTAPSLFHRFAAYPFVFEARTTTLMRFM